MSNPTLPDELEPIEDLHSAYVIDEHGNEVPITQDMIDAASQELDPSEPG